jgi:hypothetical protein
MRPSLRRDTSTQKGSKSEVCGGGRYAVVNGVGVIRETGRQSLSPLRELG